LYRRTPAIARSRFFSRGSEQNMSRAGLILLAASLSGCNVLDALVPQECVEMIYPGIEVEVRDARTGAPAAFNASGTARDKEDTYPLDVGSRDAETALQMIAFTPAGVYDLVIKKPGYQDWIATNVRVRQGECTVETEHLEARLEPIP
jgi:hypothetical protein